MKTTTLMACAMLMISTWAGCKKDDKKSSDDTTSTTSTTSTPSATDPNTLVFDGTILNNVKGECEYSNELYVSGEVTAGDGAVYTIGSEFAIPEPEGDFTAVRSPSDPITEKQCHITLRRKKGTHVMDLLPPNGGTVKVVKKGLKFKVSFGTLKFDVITGANGTRDISCTGFGCE